MFIDYFLSYLKVFNQNILNADSIICEHRTKRYDEKKNQLFYSSVYIVMLKNNDFLVIKLIAGVNEYRKHPCIINDYTEVFLTKQ